MKHKDKIVVVTGGSRGVGRDICEMFATQGAVVYFSYLSNKKLAEQFVDEITEQGGRIKALQADVSSYEQVKAMFAQIMTEVDHIDVHINNAGRSSDALFLNMEVSQWYDVINTNLNGTFHCMKEVVPIMMENLAGCIINISSIMGSVAWPGLCNYSASKAAIDALTKSAAVELGRFNIRVNAILPGLLATDMSESTIDRIGVKIKKMIPLGKLGTTQDVAKMTDYLASDDAAYITGGTLTVTGGLGIGMNITS